MTEKDADKDQLRLKNIKVLLAGWVIWTPVQEMSMPYSQLYKKELGASPFIISLMDSVFNLSNSVSKILGGYLTDKYGRRKVLWIGTLLVSLSYLLYALAPTWEWLFVADALNGIALFYQPALTSVLADSTIMELRGRIYSLIHVVPDVLSTFSPLGGAWIVENYGLVEGMRLLYTAAMAAGLIVTFMRWRWIEETLTRSRREFSFREAYKESINFIKRNLIPLLMMEILVTLVMSLGFLYSYYKFYFLGINEIQLGILATLTSGVRIVFTYPLGYLVDKVGRGPVLKTSFVLGLVAAAAIALAPARTNITFPYIILAEVISVVWMIAYWSVIAPLTADIVPLKMRGRVQSILDLITSLVWIVGTLVAGKMYESLGPRIPFMLQAILMFAIMPLIWKLIDRLTREVDKKLKNKTQTKTIL